MNLNVEQMYDAVEGKRKVEPRPLRMGDVLKHANGDPYFIFAAEDLLILSHLQGGGQYSDGATAHDPKCLTREEASAVCGGNPDCFRLVGRAKDVVVVNDPGE